MSARYLITCDNTCDLPQEFIEKNALPMAYLGYSVDGTDYGGSTHGQLPAGEFYARLRQGSMSKTTQVNPEGARALFEPLLKQGYDILHIAFSSGLSGTYSSMEMAAQELREDSRPKMVVGDGARLCYDYLSGAGLSCRLAPPHLIMQNAASVALEAEDLAAAGGLVSAQDLQPVYLRPAQAQRLKL